MTVNWSQESAMDDMAIPEGLKAALMAKQELIRATKGFMPTHEGVALAASLAACEPASSMPAVEIGSYAGLSTLYLGLAARLRGTTLLSVDHHRGSEENQKGWEYHDNSLVDPVSKKMDTLYLFRRTLELAELSETVITVVADSATYARIHSDEISYLFIDGGHSLQQVESDFECWTPKIARGGRLAIHDVFSNPDEGGQAPFNVYMKALDHGFKEIMSVGSLRIMTRDLESLPRDSIQP